MTLVVSISVSYPVPFLAFICLLNSYCQFYDSRLENEIHAQQSVCSNSFRCTANASIQRFTTISLIISRKQALNLDTSST